MIRYLSIEETADALGVHTNTVRRMLPKLGATDLTHGNGKRRLIRIPETAIEAWLRGGMILPPPEKTAQPTEYHFERRRA